jgi:hypothetical protein
VQINGHLHGPFPIHCGVLQGCPLSMALCTLCLHPFLTDPEHRLPVVCLGRAPRPVSVVAYAVGVTVFLTSVSDESTVEDAIRQFEKASGARLNPQKSQAPAIGRWLVLGNPLGIAYHPTARHTRLSILDYRTPFCQRHVVLPHMTSAVPRQRLLSKRPVSCTQNYLRSCLSSSTDMVCCAVPPST